MMKSCPPQGASAGVKQGRALGSSGFLLQEPLSQTLVSSKALAAALLQSWSESHSQLKEAVERHLTGRGLTTPGPNLQEKLFRGYWPVDQWEVEREAFAQTYDDDFDPDDVALMMCYVSGNYPQAVQSDTESGASASLNDVLSASLSRLRELPASAPEWERQIPDFIASVSRLVEEKAAQLRWTGEFDSAIRETRDTYGELLEFFECDTERWTGARVSPEADSSAALKLTATLKSRLAEYHPVHERAPSISEELQRSRRRSELQPAIIETVQAIASLMTVDVDVLPSESLPIESPAPSADTPIAGQDPAKVTDHLHQRPFPDSQPPSPKPKHELPEMSLKPPSSSGADQVTGTPEGSREPSVQIAEFDALRTENVGLRDNRQALLSENQDLREEVEALKTELFSSQEREDSWRLAYRTVKDGSTEEVGVSPPVVESVLEAVETAKGRFRQELLFAPNSESSIEDNPFTDPLRVWEALEWLGTTYYASRMGRLRVTDFDQSVKEACGWWYKGDQGETTVSRYEKSYTTRVDGKRYTLVEHIGKGTTFDARYTIRIAFDWDRDKRQVIVGYIGRHQQTDAS